MLSARHDAMRRVDPGATSNETLVRARLALDELFGPVAQRGFAVRFWDGTVDAPQPAGAAPFTLVFTRPGALRATFFPPSEVHLGEGFVRGDVDVEGDLESAAELADTVRARLSSPNELARFVLRALALPRDEPRLKAETRELGEARHAPVHSRARDSAAIRSHYDLGNEFYRLWLDADMVYSCAYFQTGDESIDEAQRAKIDHLCRKLRLHRGERLLDIGCGWGALVRHAAEHYHVSALGVTLSPSQAAFANERIYDAGLAGQCAVQVVDYRDLPGQQFDKIVSVGMFEHVGRAQLPTYFRAAYALLKPGGLFVNHGIVSAPEMSRGLLERARRALWREGKFIDRHVFPDGELVQLDSAIGHAERAGFETRDVESLREHYVLTLRRWIRRLEVREEAAIRVVGAQAYRTWRLYLAASARAFTTARIGIAQVLLAKPDRFGRVRLPLTRTDLYRASIPDSNRVAG